MNTLTLHNDANGFLSTKITNEELIAITNFLETIENDHGKDLSEVGISAIGKVTTLISEVTQ